MGGFDPRLGREQSGLRPAIVVGSTLACEMPNDLAIVVPRTTVDRQLPFHPAVALDRPSFAMCDQVKSISRLRLKRRQRHHLGRAEIDAVHFALQQMLATAAAG